MIHPAGVCVLCFWHEMETHLSLIWEGLKMVVCGCWWSWNLSGIKVPAQEVRAPGCAFPTPYSAVPARLVVFPVACSFRNLCSQLHYNFLAKKYKTQLNFNHVNSYDRIIEKGHFNGYRPGVFNQRENRKIWQRSYQTGAFIRNRRKRTCQLSGRAIRA